MRDLEIATECLSWIRPDVAAHEPMLERIETNFELREVEAFSCLSNGQLTELESQFQRISISSGEKLIRQGDPADSLFLVVSGRFRVTVDGNNGTVDEIGAGQPIGEIGFFAGGARTANVVACRDSLVVKLTRENFDQFCRRSPEIWPSIGATLAMRLARTTAGHSAKVKSKPRTIALCQAGRKPIPESMVRSILDAFPAETNCKLLTSTMIREQFRAEGLSSDVNFTRWLNDQEANADYLLFLADPELTDWSTKAIRQADVVLRIGLHESGGRSPAKLPNPVEKFADSIHAPATVLSH